MLLSCTQQQAVKWRLVQQATDVKPCARRSPLTIAHEYEPLLPAPKDQVRSLVGQTRPEAMMPPFSRGLRRLRLTRNALIREQRRPLTQGRDRFFRVSEEVQDALKTGKPVVALETTIYTHGELMLQTGRFRH